jgi:signal transduction histidine kinase
VTTHLPRQTLVLVVDDEEAGRFVKTQILRRAGFEVVEACTGREAQDLVLARAPDLILLDINLPDMSGFQLASILKTLSVPPAPQVLQVSSTSITNADRVRSLSSGADAYLAEPVDSDVLLATVNALLRVRRIEMELAAALERERAAREEAERANRSKDEFLAGLSHELRTPLNAIMGWIWQLRHSTLGEQGRARALASLERNTQLQVQLVNDLLDVSRLSRGKMQLVLRAVDMETVVDAAIDSVRNAAQMKRLDLNVQTGSLLVCGDAVRLQQVVANLLTNAVHFTAPGGQVDVIVTRGTDDMLMLQVRDTGSGIAPDFLPFVFEKFRQADSGIARQHGGLGVGLAIVKDVVELHGGTVSVESGGLGHGACFSIALPLADEAVQSLQRRAGDQPILNGVRILLLHDDAAARAQIASILEACGAEVDAQSLSQLERETIPDDGFDIVVGASTTSTLPQVVMTPALTAPGRLIAAVAAALLP